MKKWRRNVMRKQRHLKQTAMMRKVLCMKRERQKEKCAYYPVSPGPFQFGTCVTFEVPHPDWTGREIPSYLQLIAWWILSNTFGLFGGCFVDFTVLLMYCEDFWSCGSKAKLIKRGREGLKQGWGRLYGWKGGCPNVIWYQMIQKKERKKSCLINLQHSCWPTGN